MKIGLEWIPLIVRTARNLVRSVVKKLKLHLVNSIKKENASNANKNN